MLRDAGHNPAPETMRRITITLEALASYGSHPDAPAAGRLIDDVDPPGFEALAALVPSGGRRPGTGDAGGARRVVPFRATQRKKATGMEAQKDLEGERRRRVAAARAALLDTKRAIRSARAKETEKATTETEKQLEKAALEADRARQEARRVATDAENAAQEAEDAERALEKARRELEALSIVSR